MAAYVETAEYAVGLTFFRKKTWVKDKATGQIAYPPGAMVQKLSLCMSTIERTALTSSEAEYVSHYIMARFVGSALHPKTFGAEMFLSGDPQTIVHSALMAFRDAKPTSGLPDVDAADLTPFTQRYDLRSGYTLWVNGAARKAWAETTGMTAPTFGEDRDVRKYLDIQKIILDDLRFAGWATQMLHELQLLLAKVILNHRREGEFFRDWDSLTIADRLQTYCRERADRQQVEP